MADDRSETVLGPESLDAMRGILESKIEIVDMGLTNSALLRNQFLSEAASEIQPPTGSVLHTVKTIAEDLPTWIEDHYLRLMNRRACRRQLDAEARAFLEKNPPPPSLITDKLREILDRETAKREEAKRRTRKAFLAGIQGDS